MRALRHYFPYILLAIAAFLLASAAIPKKGVRPACGVSQVR